MFAPLVIGLLAAAAPQQTDTTVSVRPNARLELEVLQGSIFVRTWDRSQVRVQATHGRSVHVDVSATSSTVRIDAEGRGGGPPPNIDFKITVPTTMSLDLSGTYTDIDVQGVQGEIEAETVDGNVVVSGGTGRVRLESVQGDVRLSNARGRVEVSTVNRNVVLEDVNGEINAETVNGAIIMRRIQSASVDAATVNGTIVYDGTIRDGGDYLMATHNGSLWIVVPRGTNASVNVDTFNGKLDASFPVSMSGSSRRRFSFTLGNGSAKLDLETFGGDVRLRLPGESLPNLPTPPRPRRPRQEH